MCEFNINYTKVVQGENAVQNAKSLNYKTPSQSRQYSGTINQPFDASATSIKQKVSVIHDNELDVVGNASRTMANFSIKNISPAATKMIQDLCSSLGQMLSNYQLDEKDL